MKNIARPYTLATKTTSHLSESGECNFFVLPLSDCKILELQDIFMTCSVHEILTSNIESGRELMKTFLDALHYYQNIGCLTLSKNQNKLPDTIFNIYELIEKEQSLDIEIEMLFIDHPEIDFVWIEYNKELQKKISPEELEKICYFLKSYEQMPVIVLKYEN